MVCVSEAHAFAKGNFNHLLPRQLDERGRKIRFNGETYLSRRSKGVDVDENGSKETMLFRYECQKKVIIRFTTKGKTWAWAILLNREDKADEINNYVVYDSNGDGIFNRKYGGSENFNLPDYLKE
jgi:hypothetical protein